MRAFHPLPSGTDDVGANQNRGVSAERSCRDNEGWNPLDTLTQYIYIDRYDSEVFDNLPSSTANGHIRGTEWLTFELRVSLDEFTGYRGYLRTGIYQCKTSDPCKTNLCPVDRPCFRYIRFPSHTTWLVLLPNGNA